MWHGEAQRHLPHPVGRASRAVPPDRSQTAAPPRGRRPRPDLRGLGAAVWAWPHPDRLHRRSRHAHPRCAGAAGQLGGNTRPAGAGGPPVRPRPAPPKEPVEPPAEAADHQSTRGDVHRRRLVRRPRRRRRAVSHPGAISDLVTDEEYGS